MTSKLVSPQLGQRKLTMPDTRTGRPALSSRLRRRLVERIAAARAAMTAKDARLAHELMLQPDMVVAAGVADDPAQVLRAGSEFARRPEVAPLVAEERRAAAQCERLLRGECAALAADPVAARATRLPGLSLFKGSQRVQARRIRIHEAVQNLLCRLERRDRQIAAAKSQRRVIAPARRPRARRSHRVVRVTKTAAGDSGDGDDEPPRPRARGPPSRVGRAVSGTTRATDVSP